MPTVSAVDPGFDEFSYETGDTSWARGLQPEVVLWIEVIGQLLQDATIEDAKIAKAEKRKHLDGADSLVYIRESARSFLFAKSGTTAAWYADVCRMADLDPEFVRGVAIRAIKSGIRIRKDSFSQAVKAPDENLSDTSVT